MIISIANYNFLWFLKQNTSDHYNHMNLSIHEKFLVPEYSSLPNRRDVTAINFLRIFHQQVCYFSHRVY